MYPSIFNRFPVIQPVSSKVRQFSTFLSYFGLPWVCPWDNRGKSHMHEKMIQCLLNASQYIPIYLQPFPSNSTRSSKVRHFSTFFAHFCLIWVRPWDNRQRIQYAGQTLCSMYPSIFNRLRAIARYCSEIAIFFLPLAFNAPLGVIPLDDLRDFCG